MFNRTIGHYYQFISIKNEQRFAPWSPNEGVETHKKDFSGETGPKLPHFDQIQMTCFSMSQHAKI
jgi:hypothetical protein